MVHTFMTDTLMHTTIIQGRYQILHPLDPGGMSSLYLAQDIQGDELVVIKIMTPIQEDDKRNHKALERFQREIAIARKLSHPHVLPILDAGYIQQEDGLNVPYFTTKYIKEGSLADYMDHTPPWKHWTLQQTADAVTQAAESLWYLHTRTPPIVHQDVKPGNFLYYVVNSPRRAVHLYLCDFGISRLQRSDIAFASEVIGTAAYMAPEQLESYVMPASDQYALAIVACQLLTGKLPLQAETNKEYAYAHLNELPIPPSELNPGRVQDQVVDEVILRALAKEPNERYATIREFGQAFAHALLNHTQHYRTEQDSHTFFIESPPRRIDGQPQHNNEHQKPVRALRPPESIMAPISLEPPDTTGNLFLDEPLPAKPVRPIEQQVVQPLRPFPLQSPLRIALPGRPRMLSWSPDGNSIASTFFSHAPVYIRPHKPLQTIQLAHTTAQAMFASWSPDSRILAIATAQSIHFWDTIRHIELPLTISLAGPIGDIHWSARSMLAVWMDDQFMGSKIMYYPLTYTHLASITPPQPVLLEQDPYKGDLYTLFSLRPGNGEVLRWSPDGNYLAVGASNGVIICWGLDGRVWQITPEGPKVTGLAWSPDSSLLVAGLYDKQVLGWDTRTRNVLFRWQHLSDMPHAISVAKHGPIVIASGAQHLLFGEPDEVAPTAQFGGQLLASWSPTRRELATLDEQHNDTLVFWHDPNREH